MIYVVKYKVTQTAVVDANIQYVKEHKITFPYFHLGALWLSIYNALIESDSTEDNKKYPATKEEQRLFYKYKKLNQI